MKLLTIILLFISTITFSQSKVTIKTVMVDINKMSVHEILSNGTDSVIRYTAKSIESSNGTIDGSTISFFTRDYTYIVDSQWIGNDKRTRFITLVLKMDLWGNTLYRKEYIPTLISETSIVKQ